jgi:hypothetical protein
MRNGKLELSGRSVRIGLAAAFGLFVLVTLGLLAGVGFKGLSSVANAYFGDSQAVGTIQNDD